RSGDSGLGGDVGESAVAIVAIELVRAAIVADVNIGEAVVVDVTDGDAVVKAPARESARAGHLNETAVGLLVKQAIGRGRGERLWIRGRRGVRYDENIQPAVVVVVKDRHAARRDLGRKVFSVGIPGRILVKPEAAGDLGEQRARAPARNNGSGLSRPGRIGV